MAAACPDEVLLNPRYRISGSDLADRNNPRRLARRLLSWVTTVKTWAGRRGRGLSAVNEENPMLKCLAR